MELARSGVYPQCEHLMAHPNCFPLFSTAWTPLSFSCVSFVVTVCFQLSHSTHTQSFLSLFRTPLKSTKDASSREATVVEVSAAGDLHEPRSLVCPSCPLLDVYASVDRNSTEAVTLPYQAW